MTVTPLVSRLRGSPQVEVICHGYLFPRSVDGIGTGRCVPVQPVVVLHLRITGLDFRWLIASLPSSQISPGKVAHFL